MNTFYDPTIELHSRALKVLNLIVAEFASDPMSVQCFDLRTVEEAKAIIAERKRLEKSGECPPILTAKPMRQTLGGSNVISG